jgi:general secretion pathway protein H
MTPAGKTYAAPSADGAEAGFSLVELLVVVAIVAVVATTATLRIGAGDDSRRLSRATAAVVDVLKRARMTAIETGTSVRVAIDPSSSVLKAGDRPGIALDPNIRIAFDNVRKAPRATAADAAVTFLSDGRSSGGRITDGRGQLADGPRQRRRRHRCEAMTAKRA